MQEIPFTNRTVELERLKRIVDAVSETNQGCLVFLWGAAGIGKTRLAEEIKKFVFSINFRWLSAKCNRSDNVAPYSP